MKRWAITLALAGCGPGLKHHASHNAPGIVDVDAPPAQETADPAWYEVPADPGEHALGIAPGFGAQFGIGRLSNTQMTVELDAQVHFAYAKRKWSNGRGAVGYPWDNWGATIGWAFLQIVEDRDPTTTGDSDFAPGALYAEVTRQWFVFSASAGLAFYPTPGEVAGGRAHGVDGAAQISLMAEPFGVRMRFVQDSGFEVFAGYQFELPYAVTWSQ